MATSRSSEASASRTRNLEVENEQLRTQVANLQERISSLENEREKERQDWARFKAWFTESVERKQRKRASEMSRHTASDLTPTASSRKKRKLLSQADEAILREVGIDEAVVKGLKGETLSSPAWAGRASREAVIDLVDATPKAKIKAQSAQSSGSPATTPIIRSAAEPSTSSPSLSPLRPTGAPSQPRIKQESSPFARTEPAPRATRRPRAPSPSSSEFESVGADAEEPSKAVAPQDEAKRPATATTPAPASSKHPAKTMAVETRPKSSSSASAAHEERSPAPSRIWASDSSPALTREEVLAKRRLEMEEMKRNPNKYRGKGRYAKEIPSDGKASTSLNALYEIVPEMNNGVAFAHNEVVRDRATRKKMHAYDCECCRDWYEAVGEPEPRVFVKELPTWKEEEEADEEERRQRRMQELKQNASRHRAFGPPPATPPSYWTIGFPTTQEAEEIQRKAVQADEEKRRQMDADPRYRRRQV